MKTQSLIQRYDRCRLLWAMVPWTFRGNSNHWNLALASQVADKFLAFGKNVWWAWWHSGVPTVQKEMPSLRRMCSISWASGNGDSQGEVKAHQEASGSARLPSPTRTPLLLYRAETVRYQTARYPIGCPELVETSAPRYPHRFKPSTKCGFGDNFGRRK